MIENTIIKVRGYHIDVYQHVNNACYLTFFEEARWDIFDQLDLTKKFEEANLGFVVVNANISYKKAAVLGDVLEVKSSILNFDYRKGIIKQEIYYKGTETLVCSAEIVFVIVDLIKSKVSKISEELYQLVMLINK